MGSQKSKPEGGVTPRTVYNVYGQEIDPNNNMPSNPNQLPNPKQRAPLSTTRVSSTIPKGGTENETWTYPSPQMFFNALMRKGKGDGIREEDMSVVIAVHNNMNERTWKHVLEWEKQHPGPMPKLLKFTGRPDRLTPKAWFKQWVGYGVPFDRHDWMVERDGTTRRYVIDYYDISSNAEQDAIPGLHDHDSVKSIAIDARPALDSFDSILLRAKNLFRSTGQRIEQQTIDENKVKEGHEIVAKSSKASRDDLIVFLSQKCGSPLAELDSCLKEKKQDCSREFLGVNFCLGSIVCPVVSQKFLVALKKDPESAEAVLEEMKQCISKSDVGRELVGQ